MNRRQFLGRFFQAVISAHNSKSTYGIYHPWRQYNDFLRTVVIQLQWVSISNSGETQYSYIPYISRQGTIIAVYNAQDTMIYCSAYKYNGSIRNNLSDTIYLYNMPAGAYKIKCLQYGIGLQESDNGNEIIFIVPDPPDRSTLPYNNYGPMSLPSIEVKYLFTISGLYIDAEPVLVDVGKYAINTDLFECYRFNCQAPSYETCTELYNSAAIEAGYTTRYDHNKYMSTILGLKAGGGPYTDIYQYKSSAIYYTYPVLKIHMLDNNGDTDIGALPLNGYAVDNSSYWNVCVANGLEYDPETYAKSHSWIYNSYAELSIPLTALDGSYDVIVYPHILPGLFNIEIDVRTLYSDYYYGAEINNSLSDVELDYCSVGISSRSNKEKLLKSPDLDPMESSNYQLYYGTSQLMLNIKTLYKGYYRNTEYSDYGRCSSIEYPPQKTIEKCLSESGPYFAAALDQYNNTTPTERTVEFQIQYPIEALFGHIPADKTLFEHEPKPTADWFKPRAVAGNGVVDVCWGTHAKEGIPESEYELRPAMAGYTMDLSEYDPNNQCNNGSMWVWYKNHSVFLRQNLIEVDVNAIPDHQITH